VCADTAQVLEMALAEAREGSVLVTMSSGSFEGMPHRLIEALRSSA
jgi:UDP-N-acetylmuramate-alanine ligase